MLTSLHPNSPAPDQAIRDLLDQRARASHTRFPSVSYSQRSDSPSIYSRGDYSPNTQTHFPSRRWPRSGYQMSLTGQGQPSYYDDDDDDAITTFTRTSFDQDDRDDHSLFPPADDDISVISALTPRPPVHPAPEPSAASDLDTVAESPPTEEIDEGSRMSMLGPKMRFVSKAPWELGEDDLLEEEEEPSSATDALSMFGTKMSNWRNKDQDKPSTKGLGLMTIRSRSPGSLPASNRKGSSGMNSGLYRHQHQESQMESPYGPHLSGASQSHGAIPNPLASSARSSHSVTDSLSSDYVAYRQPRASASSPVEPFPLPTHPFRPQNMSYSSRGGSTTSFRSDSPAPSDRYVHPYANPDLLPTAQSVPSAPHPRTPRMSEDRMSDEKEQQSSPFRRASESATSSPPRGMGLRKASAGALPLPVMPSRHGFGEHLESDEMSHPVSRPRVRTTSKPASSSPVRSMVPYGDQPGSPMHSLITLEQARARAQNTPNRGQGPSGIDGAEAGSTTVSTPSSTLVAGVGLAPGAVVDSTVIRGQMPRANPTFVPPSDLSSWPSTSDQKQISQPRPRTASSGKHMFGNSSGASADGDAVPAKTLKHKRSAFMKLFQGKDKERERDHKDTVSSFSDYPVRAMSTPPQLPPPSDSPVPPLPGSSIHNIKRIPPPLPLSVVVTSPSLPSRSSPQPDQDGISPRPASPPRLRQASPPLPASSHDPSYLSGQGQKLATTESQVSSTSGPDLFKPASSAPPAHTVFETLSLRPVSTIFSAKFPDLLSQSPSLPDTTSLATLKRPEYPSPSTPGFSDSRSTSLSTASDFPLTPTSSYMAGPPSQGVVPGEDQSSIITSLQEQIVNSRKMWQRQIWELEGQIKDLKAEVEELRNTGECETCGIAKSERRVRAPMQNVGVVDRPRPRLGGGNTRTVFGGGCDM